MGMIKDLLNQTRKPEGRLGKMMISSMNSGHARVSDWGMSCLGEVEPESILEIGCGGGRNAGELLKKYACATVTAVDYSYLSVEKTIEYNRENVDRGRCTVLQADVSQLPFPDASFDLATAFETIYFWPGLVHCFSEVARVLRLGGIFLIVNEADGSDPSSLKYEKIIDGMKVYPPEKIRAALMEAGFTEVEVIGHGSKPWVAVRSIK